MFPVRYEKKKRAKRIRRPRLQSSNPRRPGGPQHPFRLKDSGMLIDIVDKEKKKNE